MGGIAIDHAEIVFLAALVEAEPEAETVGEGDLLFHSLGWVDRGRLLVFDHVARQEMPAVRGGVEDDVVGRPSMPPSSAALSDL